MANVKFLTNMHFYDCICITSASYDTCDPAVVFHLGSIAKMAMHVQAVDTQAVSLLPHGLGTRILVIQLFHSVSSCPYRKDGRFVNELRTESIWLVRLSQKFVNISKTQMQPSWNKIELMVQKSLIDKSKIAEHILFG